jgi:hypothetical protein
MNHGRDGRTGRVRGRYEGLTTDQLRAMLAEYGIHEKPVGPNGEMGYLRADFESVWKAMGIAT